MSSKEILAAKANRVLTHPVLCVLQMHQIATYVMQLGAYPEAFLSQLIKAEEAFHEAAIKEGAYANPNSSGLHNRNQHTLLVRKFLDEVYPHIQKVIKDVGIETDWEKIPEDAFKKALDELESND